ncbi:MAG: helix-turn-helix transcriptional regulator [Acidobacteriota bacterium]
MKLGDVLKKEREKKGLSVDEVAEGLGISSDEYTEIEAGETPAEAWGPNLAQIAIELETPTSRLLAESGRFSDTNQGQAGPLIKGHRERREKSAAELAEALKMSEEEYGEIEAGNSPVEKYGPLFLGFAEAIEQPVFNLFYPCGLPFQELDDYP